MPDRGKRAGATTLASFDPQLFRFHHPGDFAPKDCPRDASFDHHPSPTSHREAGIMINVEGTRGYYHLSHSHLPQIVDLKTIGVQCQQPCWCHHCQTCPNALGIPNVEGDVGRPEPT